MDKNLNKLNKKIIENKFIQIYSKVNLNLFMNKK